MKPYNKWSEAEKRSWRAAARWAHSSAGGLKELEAAKAHPLISVALLQTYRRGFEAGYKAKRTSEGKSAGTKE